MNNKIALKITAFVCAVLMMLPCLASCGNIPSEKAVVGTVNGSDVYYDEVYFLAFNYMESLKTKHGNNDAAIKEELDALIKDNIIYNYAILELCKNNGLEYNDIANDIDAEMDIIIAEDFANDKAIYKEWLSTCGMTERYFEYTTGIDLLSEYLPQKYIDDGRIPETEGEIMSLISKNFVHVNHLVLFNDEGDNAQKNYAKMEEALSLLRNNTNTMYQLIEQGYTEDFSDPDGSGYFIAPGAMIEAYENAVFDEDLKVGEFTDIVTAWGINNEGEYVECYYIIEKLPLTTEIIDKNYLTLKNEYINSVINADLQRILENIEFTPNNAYLELDLLSLEEPKNSTGVIAMVIISVVIVAAITVTVVVVILKNKYKKKNISYKRN